MEQQHEAVDGHCLFLASMASATVTRRVVSCRVVFYFIFLLLLLLISFLISLRSNLLLLLEPEHQPIITHYNAIAMQCDALRYSSSVVRTVSWGYITTIVVSRARPGQAKSGETVTPAQCPNGNDNSRGKVNDFHDRHSDVLYNSSSSATNDKRKKFVATTTTTTSCDGAAAVSKKRIEMTQSTQCVECLVRVVGEKMNPISFLFCF